MDSLSWESKGLIVRDDSANAFGFWAMKSKRNLSENIERLLPIILHTMSIGRVKRYVAGILLLGVGFFVLPFTDWGKEEPWYYWVGFGSLALVVGTILHFFLAEPHQKAGHSMTVKRVRRPDDFE